MNPYRNVKKIQYHCAKESDLVKIPDGMELKEAALLGVASVPFHDARLVNLNVDDNMLFMGAGFIGQFAAQVSRAMGASVTVANVDPKRIKLAKELGADIVTDNSTDEGKKTINGMFFAMKTSNCWT